MDWSVVHTLNHFLVRNDGVEDPLKVYVQIAEALFLAILVVVCVLARHERGRPFRRAAVAAGLSAGLGLLVTAIVAHFVHRARPFVAHPSAVHLFLAHARDSSFPSDHATAAAAIAVALLLRRRFAWGAIMVALAVVLDFGRIALGLHYLTDILGGSAIGAAAAVVLWLPPLRRLIDRVSDAVGGAWDAALDAVLGRVAPQPHALRSAPGVGAAGGESGPQAPGLGVGTRATVASDDRAQD
jgi:undecaprenyl-diphosphatase